jgi:hypothetical protein
VRRVGDLAAPISSGSPADVTRAPAKSRFVPFVRPSVGFRPAHATDQKWPLLKATYRTGYQGGNREDAEALPDASWCQIQPTIMKLRMRIHYPASSCARETHYFRQIRSTPGPRIAA